VTNMSRVSTFFKTVFILGFLTVGLSGCSSLGKKWKEMISGDAPKDQSVTKPKGYGTTFNQQPNVVPPVYRQYRRTKKQDLEGQARLDNKAGSLWVMEGQGAFLFSENVVRVVGDPLAINIEGDPADQLTQKSKVISRLLNQLEERRRRALGRAPAADGKTEEAPDANAKAGKKPDPAAAAAAPTDKPENPDDSRSFSVKTVPTRIVERLVDGNYRVRGMQPFMIGTREYRVIVSGIVRSEDFNENGINASQLLDSNFDIVSAKSAEAYQ
jgi:flagellar L-ring protein precursor FlgH